MALYSILCNDLYEKNLKRVEIKMYIGFPAGTKEVFPGGSNGKESACNVGDLGLILGSGRSPGEHSNYANRDLRSI